MKILSVARTAAFLMSNSNSNNNKDSAALASVAGRSLLQRLTRIAAADGGEQRRRGLQDEGDGDGGMHEEDEEYGGLAASEADAGETGEFYFSKELRNALDQAMEFCDIDLDSFSFFNGEDIQLDLELLQYYAELFAGVCNDDDEIKFKSALDTFQTCSSFDLVGAMENLDDALVGAAFECALVSAPGLLNMTNATELDTFELPYECSEAFLGKNPLGNMIRNTVLYPDKILPCFTTLTLDIPHCTLEAWPIPVVGPILKRIGCFVGRGKNFLEIMSAKNLIAFDECLPELDDEINEDDCDNILYECEYIDETEFLLPVPFSDLTVRVAQEAGLTHVVTRYENFFDKCDYERWAGWTYTTKDFNLGSYGSQIPDPNDNTADAACGSSSSGQSVAATATSDKFGWGFFTGLLVASVVWSAVLVFRAFKQRGRMLREFDTGKPKYGDSVKPKFYGDSVQKPSVNLNNAARDHHAQDDLSHTEDSTDHEDFNTVHFT